MSTGIAGCWMQKGNGLQALHLGNTQKAIMSWPQGYGRVAELGQGTTGFAVGDRVVLTAPWLCVVTLPPVQPPALVSPSFLAEQKEAV